MKQIFFGSLFCILGCVKPDANIPSEDLIPESNVSAENPTVLIYGGPGSWKSEIAALKKILFEHNVGYEVLAPEQMNALSIRDYDRYKAVVFAGGDAPTVRKNLSFETRANLRNAVNQHGLNYLGFCAGAWLAVAPAAQPDEDVIYGFGIINGPLQDYNFLYYAGLQHAVDVSVFPDGSTRKLLWYGGPVTPNRPGTVVAKYSNGTAAISQIKSGKGLVVISGLHPATTKTVLKSLGIYDAQVSAPDFAWALLQVVVFEKTLPTF